MDVYVKLRKPKPRERRMNIGRPPKAENAEEPKYWETPLYDFVRDRFPEYCENNRVVVKTLARAMGLSSYRVYCIFRENRLSPKSAKTLIELSKNKPRKKGDVISQEELTAFLLN